MKTMRLNVRILLGAILVGACGDASDVEQVTLLDSAGVVIMESHRPAWTERGGWRLAEPQLLQIGVVDGLPEYQFENIEAVARLDDGRIAVADAGASEIRIYNELGEIVGRSGRPGDAPGEYRQIIAMGAGPGDSLWVYDFGNRRFTVLDDNAHAVRTVSVGGALSAVGAVGRLPDGSFVVQEFWSSGAGSGEVRFGLVREPAVVARLAADGSRLDTVGLFPGREILVSSEDGRAVMSAPLFNRTMSAAIWNDHIVVGTQESFEIGFYTVDGQLEWMHRVTGIDLTISEDDLRRAIEAELARVPEERRPMVRRHLESMAVPETRPAYGELLVDADDNLWAAEPTRYPQSPRYWTVFDISGVLMGRVDLPERFQLQAVGYDWALGVWRDEMDIQYVRLYRLVK